MTTTAKKMLVESAVSHRTKVVSENIGTALKVEEAARLLGIPLGTLSAWRSTKEATVERRDGGLFLVFDTTLLDRVATYRRPLRTDVEIRHGARSSRKDEPRQDDPPTHSGSFSLFDEESSGDGAGPEIIPEAVLKKMGPGPVAFSTAITLLRERASALSSELKRIEEEIRRLETLPF